MSCGWHSGLLSQAPCQECGEQWLHISSKPVGTILDTLVEMVVKPRMSAAVMLYVDSSRAVRPDSAGPDFLVWQVRHVAVLLGGGTDAVLGLGAHRHCAQPSPWRTNGGRCVATIRACPCRPSRRGCPMPSIALLNYVQLRTFKDGRGSL